MDQWLRYIILITLITTTLISSHRVSSQSRYVIFRNGLDSLMNQYRNQPEDQFNSFVKKVMQFEDTLSYNLPLIGSEILNTPVIKSFKKNYLILENFYRFAANYALSRPDDSMAQVYTKKLLSYNPYYTVNPGDEPRIEEFLEMLYPLPNLSLGFSAGTNMTNVYRYNRYSTIAFHNTAEEPEGNYSFLPGFHIALHIEYNPGKWLSLALEPGYRYQQFNHKLDYINYLNRFQENELALTNNDFTLRSVFLELPLIFRYHFIRKPGKIRNIYDQRVEKLNRLIERVSEDKNKPGLIERKKEIKELTALYTPYKKWIPYVIAGSAYKYQMNTDYSSISVSSLINRHNFDLLAGLGIRNYFRTNSFGIEFTGRYGLNNLSGSSKYGNQSIVFSHLDAIDDMWTYSFEIRLIYLYNLSHKAYEIR